VCYTSIKVKGTRQKHKEEMKMKRYNEEIKIDNELMSTIASYMDDEIRETVHAELAPCTNEEFLDRYTDLDPEFVSLLKSEFGITF